MLSNGAPFSSIPISYIDRQIDSQAGMSDPGLDLVKVGIKVRDEAQTTPRPGREWQRDFGDRGGDRQLPSTSRSSL